MKHRNMLISLALLGLVAVPVVRRAGRKEHEAHANPRTTLVTASLTQKPVAVSPDAVEEKALPTAAAPLQMLAVQEWLEAARGDAKATVERMTQLPIDHEDVRLAFPLVMNLWGQAAPLEALAWWHDAKQDHLAEAGWELGEEFYKQSFSKLSKEDLQAATASLDAPSGVGNQLTALRTVSDAAAQQQKSGWLLCPRWTGLDGPGEGGATPKHGPV